MNKFKCSFKRYYKEPSEKYVCMTTSLFFKSEYFKVSKNLKPMNKTMNKVKSFIKNIKNNIKQFINGVYPKNYYYRIYFDKTIYKLKEYKELIKIIMKNPKVQLIEFDCSNIKNINNSTKVSHIELFGTLLRFHAIFDDKSPNLETIICVDADNTYSDKFIKVVSDFTKSDKLVRGIMSITSIGFHSNDFTEFDIFNYYYLLAGGTIFKKDKIFTIDLWNKYFTNMFNQYDLMYVVNYLDFKRLAINAVLGHNEIKTQSYYSFNYGLDEIWLNFVIKKIYKDEVQKDLLECYLTKNYNFKFVTNRILSLMKYNSIVNKKEYNLFIKDSPFKKLPDIKEIKNHMEFYNILKKNKYLDRIYIQNNIKYIIINCKDLIKKRKKYDYYELTYSQN